MGTEDCVCNKEQLFFRNCLDQTGNSYTSSDQTWNSYTWEVIYHPSDAAIQIVSLEPYISIVVEKIYRGH